jgi:hypothetical protein
VAQDNGVPPLPRRVPSAERRPGSGPLARPVLSASDLDRIRAALDKADNGDLAQADADLLPAPTASGPGVATDETLAPPEVAAQPAPAAAAGSGAADAVPADAKLVPAQRPPAEQQPDHGDRETASPPGQRTAGPVPAPRENGQASPPQAPAHRGNGHASPEQVALPQRKRRAGRGKVALPPGNGQAAPEQAAVPQGNGQASLGKVRARPAPAPARPPKPAPPMAPVTPAGPSRPRGRGRTSRVVTGGAIMMLFLLSAGSAFLLTRHEGMPASRSADSQVAIRDRAAAWVASQVSRASLVSCDQVMCRALEAHRVPAADLLVLRPGAADPLRSSVIVVTAAVTRMVGSGPLDEDAPATLASFGSGDKRISIRMIFAQGAAAYASALRAGLAARKANESWLLNPRITMSAAARRQLATGQVDSRLVLTIANLASVKWPVRILTFGDQAPGASAGIPLRCAEVTVTGSRAGADLAGQARLMSGYVHGLEDFYVTARIQAVRLTGGREAVQIGFTAPSPLGWVSTSAS